MTDLSIFYSQVKFFYIAIRTIALKCRYRACGSAFRRFFATASFSKRPPEGGMTNNQLFFVTIQHLLGKVRASCHPEEARRRISLSRMIIPAPRREILQVAIRNCKFRFSPIRMTYSRNLFFSRAE